MRHGFQNACGSHTRCFRPIFWIALCFILIAGNETSFADETKRVMLLHSFGPDVKPWSDYARAIRNELNRQSPRPLNIYEHSLVTARSSDENPEIPFVQYLRALYAESQPDLIVSIGAPAAAFVQRHRHELFPTVPMLLTIVDQSRVRYSNLTDNDAVVAVSIDYLSAFRNIVQVLPDTKSVIVVVGSSPIEKYWKKEIGRQVAPLTGRINLQWTDDLSFEDFLKRASELPSYTAIFWELMVVDAAGVPYEEGSALAKLRAVSAAPIFSYTDAFFGKEIVGGPHVPVLEAGQRTAEVAIRILAGEKPSDIKVPSVGMASPKFDWRELQRWGIDESRLPANSEVYFREPSAWERYWWQITIIIATILTQAMLIQGLLYQRYRRRKAEVESVQRRAELAHVNRHVVTSGMSAAIAHEINQPLTAIMSNAEAAELLLKSKKPNIVELKNILTDIRDDDRRASEIIRRLRELMSNKNVDLKPQDLNEIVREAFEITTIQARNFGIKIRQDLAGDPLPILGDPIQLQQVVLNLTVNSIDAVKENHKTQKEIIAQTVRLNDSTVEFSISDSGPGIATEKIDQIFNAFFTTKAAGMGMGLSIARTIIEAHEGVIWAENKAGGGAIFHFRLNIAQRSL
jgi:signal transduction histidine kinase